MRVKICGLCRPADAALAAGAGADYVGVILSPGFRRSRAAAEAAPIYAAAGSCRRVGVFVDGDPAEMARAHASLGLGVVQLSGGEVPAVGHALRAAGIRVWKAVRPSSADDLLLAAEAWADAADALLLDAAGVAGGGGVAFDWQLVAGVRDRLPSTLELVVAGGLNPENVGRAIRSLRPDVVDVSSGVEAALGEKSPEAVRAFVRAARAAAGAPILEES